jgi:hypothetical protein
MSSLAQAAAKQNVRLYLAAKKGSEYDYALEQMAKKDYEPAKEVLERDGEILVRDRKSRIKRAQGHTLKEWAALLPGKAD